MINVRSRTRTESDYLNSAHFEVGVEFAVLDSKGVRQLPGVSE
jgi:hypothetical protein